MIENYKQNKKIEIEIKMKLILKDDSISKGKMFMAIRERYKNECTD